MAWRGLKDCLLAAAEEVCGKIRGRQRHRETWWWNAEVADSVAEKRRLFKIYKKSATGSDQRKMKEDKRRYDVRIGCLLAETLRWQGQRAGVEAEKHGGSVFGMTCGLWASKQSGHRIELSGGA